MQPLYQVLFNSFNQIICPIVLWGRDALSTWQRIRYLGVILVFLLCFPSHSLRLTTLAVLNHHSLCLLFQMLLFSIYIPLCNDVRLHYRTTWYVLNQIAVTRVVNTNPRPSESVAKVVYLWHGSPLLRAACGAHGIMDFCSRDHDVRIHLG